MHQVPRCDGRDYSESVHGKAVIDGNQDSAACNDCHNLHEIKPLGDPKSFENREFHTKVCMKCHADEEMMERNGVMTVAVKTYMDSYHGKNYRLGFPEKVAGCADCHTAHDVLPAAGSQVDRQPGESGQDLRHLPSQAPPPSLPNTIRMPNIPTPQEYPILFWTFVAMTGLLAGTFAVFWVHTLLWMFRGFVENREKLAAAAGRPCPPCDPNGHKQYRRFNRRHIFLHLLVIISFLGLSLTGLPLKFADQSWAHILMGCYGGAANAGLIHRICAGITFIYFGSAICHEHPFPLHPQGLHGELAAAAVRP